MQLFAAAKTPGIHVLSALRVEYDVAQAAASSDAANTAAGLLLELAHHVLLLLHMRVYSTRIGRRRLSAAPPSTIVP